MLSRYWPLYLAGAVVVAIDVVGMLRLDETGDGIWLIGLLVPAGIVFACSLVQGRMSAWTETLLLLVFWPSTLLMLYWTYYAFRILGILVRGDY